MSIPVEVLDQLGLRPDGRRLLDAIRPRMSPPMLEKIAAADYGLGLFEHRTALEQIVASGIIPDPLPLCPGEVLRLERWSEPGTPGRSPGDPGWEGHVMRAFSCTVLLISGGLPDGHKEVDGENNTLVQLVSSVLELGTEWALPTISLIYSRLVDGPLTLWDRPFFVLALLLMLQLSGAIEVSQGQWSTLSTWLDDSEAEARRSLLCPGIGPWLIDLERYGSRKNVESWKGLARRAFGAQSPAGAELIARRVAEWSTAGEIRPEEPDRGAGDHAIVAALELALGVTGLQDSVDYDRQGPAIALRLSHLGLQALPAEIGQLSQLQWLDLSGNQLTALPAEIGQLSQLQELDLSYNQSIALPPEIGQLSQLHWLHLSNNQLAALPTEIGQLSQLQKLNLSGNQLTGLPPEIVQLSQLQELDLSYNQLTALPAAIGQLSQLQTLGLRGNQLTALPPEIGQLSRLEELLLDGNPGLTWPPPEVVAQGTTAILPYLRERLPGSER
jgi:hypothetical protein